MTYHDLQRLADDRRNGAIVLTRPDGNKLYVRSLPDFGITNLTVRNGIAENTATCTDVAGMLRTVRRWYSGEADHEFGITTGKAA